MPDDSVVNSTVDLKKRARRRLVGATALALLAVIVLPIVMDSEPRPSDQEIQIRIPNQEGESSATHVIPVRPVSPPQQAASPLREAPAPATNNSAATSEKSPIPVDSEAPTSPEKTGSENPEAKPDAVKKVEVAHAEAALAGTDAGQWVVKLGTYQSAANVKQLMARIKDIGLPSYTERLDSPQGARTRVRAGPFKSQESAEKARLKIKKLGVDGSVAQK